MITRSKAVRPPSGSRRGKLFLVAVSALLAAGQAAQATPYWWDTNGSTAGASAGTTVSGTWDGTNVFFNTDSAGGAGTFIAAPTLADDVFFSAGTNVTGNSTITIQGNQTANLLTVEEGTAASFSAASAANGGGSLALGTGTSATAGITIGSGVTGQTAFGVPLVFNAGTTTITNNSSSTTAPNTFLSTGGITGTTSLVVNNTGSTSSTLGGVVNFAGTITNSGTGSGQFLLSNTSSGSVGANVTSIIQNSATSSTLIAAVNSGFAGLLDVRAGTMSVTANNFLTASTVVQLSGTGTFLHPAAATTIAGINGTSGTTFANSTASSSNTRVITLAGSGNYTFNGVIGTGSPGGTSILMAGGGTQTLGGASVYTGPTMISSGTLVAGTDALAGGVPGAFGAPAGSAPIILGNAATTTNNSSATLLIGGSYTIGRGVNVANQATTGTYTIGGSTNSNATFSGSITANQSLTISQVATTGTNALNITGGITGSQTGAKTITFAGPGAINVNTTGIGGTGPLGVSVTGGAVTFATTSTYTGGTTVTGGTLFANAAINGTTSSTGTAAGAVTVGNGPGLATLAGNGGILSAVTLTNTNSALSPGATNGSIGSLSVGALTLSNTTNLLYDLNTLAPGTGSDFVAVSGTLTLDGRLTVSGGANFGAGQYQLFSYTGTLTDNTLEIALLPAGYLGSISTTPNAVFLNVTTAVPEPSTNVIGACLGVAAAVQAFRSRRQRRAGQTA